MQVQDELCVAVADGPLPPLLGLPPVALLVQIFVQDPLPAGGIWEHHDRGGSLEQQEQSRSARPAPRCVLPHCGDRDDFKLGKEKPGRGPANRTSTGKTSKQNWPDASNLLNNFSQY